MRKADVYMHGIHAAILEGISPRTSFRFTYDPSYVGPPVSLTAPVRPDPYTYENFQPFLEVLLPEGYNLEALLRSRKIDRQDHFSQLMVVGLDKESPVLFAYPYDSCAKGQPHPFSDLDIAIYVESKTSKASLDLELYLSAKMDELLNHTVSSDIRTLNHLLLTVQDDIKLPACRRIVSHHSI